MKTLTDQLAQYGAYHRDPRNITTHFVGIPMIVLAVAVLLARPVWDVAGMAVSPAWAVSIFSKPTKTLRGLGRRCRTCAHRSIPAPTILAM